MQIELDVKSFSRDNDYIAGFERAVDTVTRHARTVVLQRHHPVPISLERAPAPAALLHCLKALRHDRAALLDLLQRWQMLRHAAYRKSRNASLTAAERQDARGFSDALERVCSFLQRMVGEAREG